MADDVTAASTEAEPEKTEEEIIAEGIAALDRCIAERARAPEELVDIVERQLRDGVDERTWSKIAAGLGTYLGDGDAVATLAWVAVADADDRSRMDHVERTAAPTTADVVRKITATYGTEMRDAYALWDQLPNNWRALNRDIYFDMVSGRYLVRVSIDKFNGETSVVEGPPDSILSMTRFLVIALKVVAGSPDAFTREHVVDFLTDTEELITVLHSAMAAEVEQAPEEAALSE
jgi:hypothetical protein